MKNIDVIIKFLNRTKASSSNGNLRSTGDKLFSYNTCIAQWVDDLLYINMTQYSPTTSKHRNMIFSIYPVKTYTQVVNVPINSHNLCKTRKKT